MNKKLLLTFILLLTISGLSARTFRHPGLLHSSEAIERTRQWVKHENPVAMGSYRKLIADPKASASYQMAGPFEVVARDAFVNAPSPIVAGMFYVVNEDGSYDYYDMSAPTTPVAGHFGSVTSFSDDGVAVCSRVGGSLCVIDRKGQVVKELPKEVSQCSMFSRGMAAFQNDNGSWGYINTSGDTIVPANYSSANMFLYNDYAMVIDENQPNDSTVSFTVINKNGKVMFTANSSEYQPVQPYFINGVLPVVKGDTLVCTRWRRQDMPTSHALPRAIISSSRTRRPAWSTRTTSRSFPSSTIT